MYPSRLVAVQQLGLRHAVTLPGPGANPLGWASVRECHPNPLLVHHSKSRFSRIRARAASRRFLAAGSEEVIGGNTFDVGREIDQAEALRPESLIVSVSGNGDPESGSRQRRKNASRISASS